MDHPYSEPQPEMLPTGIGSNIDVLRLIGENLQQERCYRTLAALARTNRSYNDIFTPMLYRDLRLNTVRSFTKFKHALFNRESLTEISDQYKTLVDAEYDLNIVSQKLQDMPKPLPVKRQRIQTTKSSTSAPVLIPSMIRGFVLCRFVETLHLKHEILRQDAQTLDIAARACNAHESLLFPKLERIIIDGPVESDVDRNYYTIDTHPSRIALAKALHNACKPLHLCVNEPIRTRSEICGWANGRLATSEHYKFTVIHRPQVEPFWYQLTQGLSSLKTVIIHEFIELQQYVANEALHRLGQCRPRTNSPGDMPRVGDGLPRARGGLIGSLVEALQPLGNTSIVELRAQEGLETMVGSAQVNDLLFEIPSEYYARGTLVRDARAGLHRAMARVKFIPEDEARPDCEACHGPMP